MKRANISAIHDYIREARRTRRGATMLPGDVPHGEYKEYPRMPQIALPKDELPDTLLVDAIQNRTSHRGAWSDAPLTLEAVSALLGSLRIQEGSHTRAYPSGGGLYPIETYLVGAVAGAPARVYHYHPAAHALESLWDIPAPSRVGELFASSVEHAGTLPSAAIIFTAVWERSAKKYGDFTYNLALLEAGHMAQNIVLMATALGLDTRPMGGFVDEKVHELLDVDGKSEQAVYAIAIS